MQLAAKEGAIKICNRQKSYVFMGIKYRGIYLQAQAALHCHLMLQKSGYGAQGTPAQKMKQLRLSHCIVPAPEPF